MKNTTEQGEAEGAISFEQKKHKLQKKTPPKKKSRWWLWGVCVEKDESDGELYSHFEASTATTKGGFFLPPF